MENSPFTVTCENMKSVLVLFKVKHNGSIGLGYFIFVFDYFYSSFYQIICFSVLQKKKCKENRRKKGRRKLINLDRFQANLQTLETQKNVVRCPAPNISAGWGLTEHLSPCQLTQLNQAHFSHFRFAMLASTNSQFFFSALPPE